MSLRFFADHCVPMEVARHLRAARHQVILLRDAMPRRSPDVLVLAKAAELNCVLIFSANPPNFAASRCSPSIG